MQRSQLVPMFLVTFLALWPALVAGQVAGSEAPTRGRAPKASRPPGPGDAISESFRALGLVGPVNGSGYGVSTTTRRGLDRVVLDRFQVGGGTPSTQHVLPLPRCGYAQVTARCLAVGEGEAPKGVQGRIGLINETKRGLGRKIRTLIKGGAVGVVVLTSRPARELPALAEMLKRQSRLAGPGNLEGVKSLDDLPDGIRERIEEKLSELGIDPEDLGGKVKIQVRSSLDPEELPEELKEKIEKGEVPEEGGNLFPFGRAAKSPVSPFPVAVVAADETLSLRLETAAENGVPVQIVSRCRPGDLGRRYWAGLLRGSDRRLTRECVVLAAHFEATAGADLRTAPGVATVLEAARILASGDETPRRSVVFLIFDRSRADFRCSRHYVRQPMCPLEKTVALVQLETEGAQPDGTLRVAATDPKLIEKARSAAGRGVLFQETEANLRRGDTRAFVGRGVSAIQFHPPKDLPTKQTAALLAEFVKRLAGASRSL